MTAIRMKAKMGYYWGEDAQGRATRRVYIELDPVMAARHFTTMPAYLRMFAYANGSLGGKFTIDKGTIMSRRRGKWIIELGGLLDGRNASIWKSMGRAAYGETSTTVLFFPRTGTLRIHQPPYPRKPVEHREDRPRGPNTPMDGRVTERERGPADPFNIAAVQESMFNQLRLV